MLLLPSRTGCPEEMALEDADLVTGLCPYNHVTCSEEAGTVAFSDAEEVFMNSVDTAAVQLDLLDRRLLDIIQTDFPLEPRPYAVLGERLGISEEEALERVNRLRRSRIIRRLGANFQSSKLGFRSTLCAASVPDEKLDAFIEEVNRHVGVTHNYLRNHSYNVWFSVIGPSWQDICELVDTISQRTGVPVLNLPASRMYKIRVDFQMEEEKSS